MGGSDSLRSRSRLSCHWRLLIRKPKSRRVSLVARQNLRSQSHSRSPGSTSGRCEMNRLPAIDIALCRIGSERCGLPCAKFADIHKGLHWPFFGICNVTVWTRGGLPGCCSRRGTERLLRSPQSWLFALSGAFFIRLHEFKGVLLRPLLLPPCPCCDGRLAPSEN